MDTTIFAKRLKEARTAAGLTQSELSKVAGVTAATISAYESADGTKGKNPSLDNALKLAQALHESLDWLCGSIVTNEKFQITDCLKMFVKLSEHCEIAIDEIDFSSEKETMFIPNAVALTCRCEDDCIYYSEIEECTGKVNLPILFINNEDVNNFFVEWHKIHILYKSGTIDKNLYNLWLNQQYQKVDEKQKRREEFYKELEDEANKPSSSKDGEPDGND